MSAMPLLGTETEYGILAPQRPDVHPSVLSGLVVDGYSGAGTQPRLYWDGPVPIEDAHNRFLGNGARLYVDHAHPEYSTPEVTTARAALVAELAGDAIVVEGALAAGRALNDPVRLFKNNTDGKGASYGYHENYLLDRSTPWDRVVEGFLPFVVTRLPLIGAGRVGLGQTSAEAGFQISQRADFFEAITGLETTIRRPLLNTRDEPHADPARWRRLHVIAGDANRSHTSTLLKLGTAAAVLSAIDAGVLRPVRLADPLAAVRTVSRDLNCTARLALSGGGSMTALQIQVDYRAQLQAAGLGDPEVMQLWGDALDGLGRDPLSWLALDWVSKLNLIQSFRRRDALDWDHPRIAQLDLAYAELAERSPFSALVRAGRMPVLVSDGEVRRAVAEPPSDTRAYLRGRLVGERTSEVNAVDWSYVVMTDRRGRRRIDLDDPLTGSDQDVRDRGGLNEY